VTAEAVAPDNLGRRLRGGAFAALVAGVIAAMVWLTAKDDYKAPGLSEVRAATAKIGLPARVRQGEDINGVQVFRGEASDDGVTVHFVLLAGENAEKLVYPTVRVLVAGFRDTRGGVGLDTGEGRLTLLDDSERYMTRSPARDKIATRISLAIEDALTTLD
jgi:hypothetical protein